MCLCQDVNCAMNHLLLIKTIFSTTAQIAYPILKSNQVASWKMWAAKKSSIRIPSYWHLLLYKRAGIFVHQPSYIHVKLARLKHTQILPWESDLITGSRRRGIRTQQMCNLGTSHATTFQKLFTGCFMEISPQSSEQTVCIKLSHEHSSRA